ncbi:MAG: Trm112 family protein [Planctomycetota bacterium]
MLDPKFLEILACPYCKGEVREEGDRLFCARSECSLVFAVEEGIPIMLVEEAAKPCPKCREERDFLDEELVCKACGTRFRYEPEMESR